MAFHHILVILLLVCGLFGGTYLQGNPVQNDRRAVRPVVGSGCLGSPVGFAHFFQPNATVWSSVAIAIEAGVLLGVAFKYSGSLWLPIGIHWAWNFTQGNVFGFSVSGSAKTASVFDPTVCGPELITVGAFGPEASVITVVLCSLLALLMLVRLGGKRNSQAAR